jgi:hypothetical protein
MALQQRRARGRPRKDGSPTEPSILARALAEAGEEQSGPPGIGANVTDETRLQYLERARIALAAVDEAKLVLKSAAGIFTQVVKDAHAAGATQIKWTLKQLRRAPEEIAAEIAERNKMLVLAKIPVGVQLGLFAGAGETLAEVLDRQAQASAEDAATLAAVQEGQNALHPEPPRQGDAKPAAPVTPSEALPPKPGPDDPGEPEQEDEGEPDEDEDEPEAAKTGNEVLERSPEDASAYKMGQRSFGFGRHFGANPFPAVSSMSNAWARGWKSAEAAKAAAARAPLR